MSNLLKRHNLSIFQFENITLILMKLNSRTPLLLALLVGVASSKHIGHHGNKKPMISSPDKIRICADLCASGLGGEPCGAFCFDLTPKAHPNQSANFTHNVKDNLTRSDACPLLCENNLGYPFCQCSRKVNNRNNKKVDYNKICDHYCHEQRWWLHGCPVCEVTRQYGGTPQNGRMSLLNKNAASTDVDWGKWCDQQCAESNGGSACNCDILPFSLI